MFTLTINYTDGTHVTDKMPRINEGGTKSEELKYRMALSEFQHEVREAEFGNEVESVILFDAVEDYNIQEWYRDLSAALKARSNYA